jgi:hypothetical protein
MKALCALLFGMLTAACSPIREPRPRPQREPATAAAEGVANRRPAEQSETPPGAPIDDEISAMVRAVDGRRMLDDVRALAAFGTRHSLSDTKSNTRGVGAAARFLEARFREIAATSGGRLEVAMHDFVAPKGPRVPQPWPMQNVLATLPGTAAGAEARVLVVSGHYDSRASDIMNAAIDAPGANDDASGVAVVLEACRAMAPYRFEATLVFAAVSGEEQGLLGSQALVERLKGARVEAMFTNDIVGNSRAASGRADTARVRVFSAGLPHDPALRDELLAIGGESDGPSRQLARAVREAAASYVSGFEALLVHRLDRYLRGGDHKPFHEAGAPVVRFTEVEENFHRQHQDVRTEGGVDYGDVAEHVDPAYMANVARVNVASLASLARAPMAPQKVRLDVRGLDEDTTLLYVPDESPTVGYEVLARPTQAPLWTRSFPLDRSGRARIPLSKDHWIFALRAVGPKGHRSLPVLPLPLKAGDAWPP